MNQYARTHRKHLILLAIVTALVPTHAKSAWEMVSDFRLTVDKKSLDLSVDQQWQDIQNSQVFQLSDINVSGQVPVSISGIRGQVEYVIAKPVRQGTALEWEGRSRDLSVSLRIASISASSVIRVDLGNGHSANVRVQAVCRDVRLSIPITRGAEIIAGIKAELVDGNFKLSAPYSEVQWPEDAWQIDQLNCEGATNGFDTIVRDEAMKALRSPQESVQLEVAKAIGTELDVWASEALNVAVMPRVLFSDRDNVEFHMDPLQLTEQDDERTLIEGIMHMKIKDVVEGKNVQTVYKFDANEIANGPTNNNEVQLPKDALKGFAMGATLLKAFSVEKQGYTIEPWQQIMQSRWTQFFVWSDLMSFDKNADFRFRSEVRSVPKISNLEDIGDGIVRASFVLPISVNVYAPDQKAGHVPYVQFVTNMRGVLESRISDDGKLQLKVKNMDLADLSYKWSQSYVKNNSPNTHIGISTISGRLTDFFTETPFSVELPHWEWSSGERLDAVEFALEDQTLRVFWALK